MKLLREWLKKSGTTKPGDKKSFFGTLNLYFEDHAPAQLRALLQDIKTAIDLERGLLTLHQKFLKKRTP